MKIKKDAFLSVFKIKDISKMKSKTRRTTIAKLWAYIKEKERATHSSILAWRIPGTEEPGGLPCMGSHWVGYDWSDLAAAARWLYCSSSCPLYQLYCWSRLWLQSLAVHSVCTVRYTQDRQSRAKRLEGDSKNFSNCRHVFSLLADAAAIAAAIA